MCWRTGQTVAVIGMMILVVGRGEAACDWLDDLDQGKRLALEKGKDLLINFTGTDWCQSCTELRRDVLDRPAFVPAGELFVMVELEFPASSDQLPEKKRDRYLAWRDHYGIRGFPTVLLADAAGRPYAVTGNIGVKPEEYVRHLCQLCEAHRAFDAALAKARTAQGVEKARYLDDALSALQRVFPSDYTEIQGDPLVRFYRPEIEEILSLDGGGKAGLRDKYRAILDAETERRQMAELKDRITTVAKKEGFGKAIILIDQELGKTTSAKLRRQLRSERRFYLEWSDRYAEAAEYTRELLKDETLSADDRHSLRRRLAFNLIRSGRIDEGVAVYDDLVREAAGNPRAIWSLLREKAGMLEVPGRLQEALRVWESARKYVKPGSDEWDTTEYFCLVFMLRLGRFDDAEALYQKESKRSGAVSLHAASLLRTQAHFLNKAGRNKEALEKVRQAEEVLARLKPTTRDDARFADEIRRTLKIDGDEAETKSQKAKSPGIGQKPNSKQP